MMESRPSLLVADDSAALRELVRTCVGDSYAEIIEVEDGRALFWRLVQACYAAHDTPDLVVVTDIRMPVYDGLEVLEAWQALRCPVPLVVVTAFPDDQVRARVAQLGAQLLVKPFTVEELRLALRQARGTPAAIESLRR